MTDVTEIRFPTRLGFGKGFVGADFPGCVNSGFAPALFKSKLADRILGKPFIVGGEHEVRFEGRKNIAKAELGEKTEVKFYKTYASAKKEFSRLSEKVRGEHESARKARETVRKATPGTPEHLEAVLNAADYGV